jgi:hypothetical protein
MLMAKSACGILCFLAYHAYKRENAGKPVKSYEIWSETVADVTVGDDNPKATPGSIRRVLVNLAIETGIPMQYWDDADDILTAVEILKERSHG